MATNKKGQSTNKGKEPSEENKLVQALSQKLRNVFNDAEPSKTAKIKESGGSTHPISKQWFESCLSWVEGWNDKRTTLNYPVLPQPSYPGPIGVAAHVHSEPKNVNNERNLNR